jgi:hypothetical protein
MKKFGQEFHNLVIGILRLKHFNAKTDIVSTVFSISEQVRKWRWKSIMLFLFFLIFQLAIHYIIKKRPQLF